MALMKCGWLWRKSSVLRRWKRSWFDLWMDGNLVFYQDETRRDYEDRIRLKYKCANVKAGSECTGVEPPDGISSHCLVIIYMKNGSTLILCADSEDEALAWKLTMLEVKVNPVHVYNPYDDNYHTVPLDGHNAVYISPGYPGYSYGAAAGVPHVVVQQQPCGMLGGEVALGMLAGMATGAALRTLMWIPFWC
ncbi:si:ch211-176g13.7 isoform X2 [Polyodon spathula]|uniref:si:ch211-176g13.7 isoform X2 n=1 Tax=Polyodon spathula TaxID=7913 RepID=UPI001B7DF5D6|nr:si:ch211-176g13.7 isoform X2 [Polyodon spathula]